MQYRRRLNHASDTARPLAAISLDRAVTHPFTAADGVPHPGQATTPACSRHTPAARHHRHPRPRQPAPHPAPEGLRPYPQTRARAFLQIMIFLAKNPDQGVTGALTATRRGPGNTKTSTPGDHKQ